MQSNTVIPHCTALLQVVLCEETRSNAGRKGWWMACVWPKQPLRMTKYSPCHKVYIKDSHSILSNDSASCSLWKWPVKPLNEQNRHDAEENDNLAAKKVELQNLWAWKHSCIFIIWFYRGSIWAFLNSHRLQWKMIKTWQKRSSREASASESSRAVNCEASDNHRHTMPLFYGQNNKRKPNNIDKVGKTIWCFGQQHSQTESCATAVCILCCHTVCCHQLLRSSCLSLAPPSSHHPTRIPPSSTPLSSSFSLVCCALSFSLSSKFSHNCHWVLQSL